MKNYSITEEPFLNTKPLDKLALSQSIQIMLDEQIGSVNAVIENSKQIETIVDEIATRLNKRNKSRIIYCGAGTSGRIAVQDGVELTPTFGWPESRIGFLIAGGKSALLNSIENAEDSVDNAHKDVSLININKDDIVLGLAASGNTPYTCGVLKRANELGAFTISISNNPNGKILKYGKRLIILDTKQEVIAGSTRLKAGTSQKVCLNVISTLVMTKLGFVKDGLMINLQPLNKKLIKRKAEIEKILTNSVEV